MRGVLSMRRIICVVVVILVGLVWPPGMSQGHAAPGQLEVEFDYMPRHLQNRHIDTVSLHILEPIAHKNNRTVFRGITVTRPYGYIVNDSLENKDSSAVGIGPLYMVRNEKQLSGKLWQAFDMSGGLILYDKQFPDGAKMYNFMWRLGPRLIYKTGKNSSLHIGYMFMHVSNGLTRHNPAYNTYGFSAGVVAKF